MTDDARKLLIAAGMLGLDIAEIQRMTRNPGQPGSKTGFWYRLKDRIGWEYLGDNVKAASDKLMGMAKP